MVLSASMGLQLEEEHIPAEYDSGENLELKARKFHFYNAKTYLLTSNSVVNDSVYEHVVKIIKCMLKNSEESSLDDTEQLSRCIKRRLHNFFREQLNTVDDRSPERSIAFLRRNKYQQPNKKRAVGSDTESSDIAVPDITGTLNAFMQAGIGFDINEAYNLLLSMRDFVKRHRVDGLRFWGKIYGTKHSYYIIETDNDLLRINVISSAEIRPENGIQKTTLINSSDEFPPDGDMDPPPKPDWRAPSEIPMEEPGKGLNKKAYYVCNELHEDWTRLPEVTPRQISTGRFIRHLFTGDLDAEVDTNPPFPGVERNLLRVQIARISATTMISPATYYQFDEEEEADIEEDALRENYVENNEYEPMSISELTEDSLANWVHHSAYILPQGRTTWWNPSTNLQAEVVDSVVRDEEEEELDEQEELEPEAGPPLLTPLSEDAQVAGLPPWSTRITSHLVPQHAYALLSSNLWPGAHAIASGRFFENIYIGWGQKYLGADYAPVVNLEVYEEFPSGPEIAEVEDPTAEEEAAWKAAQAEAARIAAEEAEGEEEEEEGSEEEEEEDD